MSQPKAKKRKPYISEATLRIEHQRTQSLALQTLLGLRIIAVPKGAARVNTLRG